MTIAQRLNIKKFPFQIRNAYGNEIYYENKDQYWEIKEYDSKGNTIYLKNSKGFWEKREYDSKRNERYYEDSNGFWIKKEYDSKGNEIYVETSDGSKRSRKSTTEELTLDEIAKKFSVPVENLRIKI